MVDVNEKTKENEYKEWLRTVEDPELFIPIVDLGLIYTVQVDESRKAVVEMTLTSPGCPAGDYLVSEVKKRLTEHEDVDETEVRIVWEPKWDPAEMASDEAKETLGIW